MQSPSWVHASPGYRTSELVPGFLVLSLTGVSSGERTVSRTYTELMDDPPGCRVFRFGGGGSRFTVAEMTHWVFALTLKLEATEEMHRQLQRVLRR